MAGFTKGQLKKEFSATGIGFADEAAIPTLDNIKLSKELTEEEPQLLKSKAFQDKQKEIELNTAKKEGGAHSIGKIETAQDQSYKLNSEKQRKKDKEFARFLTRLQEQRIEFERQINWTIKYFEQKAQETAAQAGDLRGKIVDNTERMIENSNFIREIGQLLKADKNGISIDKDKLRKLLKGQGADVDGNTPLSLLLQTAEKMVIEAGEENAVLEIDNDIYDKAASKLDTLVEGFEAQAKNLKSKFEELKTRGLSEEDYKKAADKILEGVPLEVKSEYENRNGDSKVDQEVQEENSKKENQSEAFDAMEFMDETPTENLKQESQKPLVSPPSPNGM